MKNLLFIILQRSRDLIYNDSFNIMSFNALIFLSFIIYGSNSKSSHFIQNKVNKKSTTKGSRGFSTSSILHLNNSITLKNSNNSIATSKIDVSNLPNSSEIQNTNNILSIPFENRFGQYSDYLTQDVTLEFMNKYYPNYIDNELFIYLINQLPPQIREEKDTINKLFELIINLNSCKYFINFIILKYLYFKLFFIKLIYIKN